MDKYFSKLYLSSLFKFTLSQALMALIVINVKQKTTKAPKQIQAISCWLDVINSVMAYSFCAFRSLMSNCVRAFISATEYWCSFFSWFQTKVTWWQFTFFWIIYLEANLNNLKSFTVPPLFNTHFKYKNFFPLVVDFLMQGPNPNKTH